MSSIQELFNKGKSLLRNCPQPSLETKLLIIKIASISEEEFYAFPETELSRGQEKLFYRLISRRLQGFPLAYLLGVKEFWSIPFRVFPGVLIPRPETELLVEKVIELISQEKKLIADIGTGAGNIAVSIAKEFPMARIIATDISQKALRAAQLNVSLQKISRITFIRGSLFFPLKKFDLEGKFDFIVSNPPYVSEIEWEKLQKEIKDHEPKKALVAGRTGLEKIHNLIRGAIKYLKPEGYLCFEIGFKQREKVLSFFGPEWSKVECFDDLRGIPRIIIARKHFTLYV